MLFFLYCFDLVLLMHLNVFVVVIERIGGKAGHGGWFHFGTMLRIEKLRMNMMNFVCWVYI